MRTAQNLIGKNALWAAYQDAGPVKHAEILTALKEAGLYRHFQTASSKEGYDLKTKAYGPFRDIFLRILPETAPLFGVELPRSKLDRQPKSAPLFDEVTSQPQS